MREQISVLALLRLSVLILICIPSGLVVYSKEYSTCTDIKKYESVSPKSIAAAENRQLRWAIVALARPRGIDALKRNRLLADRFRPYASNHNITILVFSEQSFDSDSFLHWQRPFKGVADVKYINTAHHGWKGKQRFGYKYMCKFFAMDIYTHLQDYDYYMRCDTDCFLTQLDYDLFQWVADNSVSYGFAVRKYEAHKLTKETLPIFIGNYMQRCGLQATAPMDYPMNICFNFYNNWHIGRVSFFLRPDVQNFLTAVNKTGGILHHRWGDSTIQAYAVRLFMNPSEIRQVPNFKYVHGSHGAQGVISTFGNRVVSKLPSQLPWWNYNSSGS